MFPWRPNFSLCLLFLKDAPVSSLISSPSPGIFPSRVLPRPSPHPLLPTSPSAPLQLPRQPVSFSPLLPANRVEQPGREGERERDERQENPRAARAHCGCALPGSGALPRSSPSQSDGGAGDNPGRGGRGRESRVPFLMQRAALRKGTRLQASASSHSGSG